MSCVIIMNTVIPWDGREDSQEGGLVQTLCNRRYINVIWKESTLFSLWRATGGNAVEFYCPHFLEKKAGEKDLKIAP